MGELVCDKHLGSSYMAMSLILDKRWVSWRGLLGAGGGMRSTECHASVSCLTTQTTENYRMLNIFLWRKNVAVMSIEFIICDERFISFDLLPWLIIGYSYKEYRAVKKLLIISIIIISIITIIIIGCLITNSNINQDLRIYGQYLTYNHIININLFISYDWSTIYIRILLYSGIIMTINLLRL